MNRAQTLRAIADGPQPFDLLVIGGGATGLGAAWDAATRGYRVLLVERDDFAQGTSSRSTKLIHGGVRYLEQLNFPLVRESLHERGLLLANAPALVSLREFVIPAGAWWERAYYGAGLKLYDALAGRLGQRKSRLLNRAEVRQRLPALKSDQLAGGISYWDGQFDDTRMALALVAAIQQSGGLAINHVRAESFIGPDDRITGANLIDQESGDRFAVEARAVVNATGVQSDHLRRLDNPAGRPLIAASRGSHIVLPLDRLGGQSALMIPRTRDGRVLFAIPWLDHLLVGTTDIATEEIDRTPSPSPEEIDFLLQHVNEHLATESKPGDILSAFAGLRPLVRPGKAASTSAIPRDHYVEVSPRGLISVAGGKWTTFRKMAEDTMERVIEVAGLTRRPCVTTRSELQPPAHPLPNPSPDGRIEFTEEQIRHAIEEQLAVTVEDILARRSRCLFLNARAALQAAPAVAGTMRRLLGKDARWEEAQLTAFRQTANQYLPDAGSSGD